MDGSICKFGAEVVADKEERFVYYDKWIWALSDNFEIAERTYPVVIIHNNIKLIAD